MTIEIKAPQFPESVADGTVATWHKKPGDAVKRDELLVDIETDKVVLEVVAPENGTLVEIIKDEGEVVLGKEVVGILQAGDVAASSPEPAAAKETSPAASADSEPVLSPAVRKLIAEHDIDPGLITGTGKGGRIVKEDVQNFLKNQGEARAAGDEPKASGSAVAAEPGATPVVQQEGFVEGREEKRVAMTRLRKRIAERLTDAQSTAAMLTTFNEVNMQPIIDLRKNYQTDFEKTHGVRLGFMSMFVRASVEALKRFPVVNASIDGDDIVYHNYFDIGVAVSTERGLVVPVIRDADQKGLAEVESQIVEFGEKARENKLAIEDITGGTFSITNGGVFGSLLSTPIINPPQTAILGMHKIQQRPMAVDGEVKIQPMMYLAVTYDHRLIDGKEAVQFLVTIKEFVEDPTRLLLDI